MPGISAPTDPPTDGTTVPAGEVLLSSGRESHLYDSTAGRRSPADTADPPHPARGSRRPRSGAGGASAEPSTSAEAAKTSNRAAQSRYRTDNYAIPGGASVDAVPPASIASGGNASVGPELEWWPEAAAKSGKEPEGWGPWRARVCASYARTLAEMAPDDQHELLNEAARALDTLRRAIPRATVDGIDALREAVPDVVDAVAEVIRADRARSLGGWLSRNPQPRAGSAGEHRWAARYWREADRLPSPGRPGYGEELLSRLRTVAGADPYSVPCENEYCSGSAPRPAGTWDRWSVTTCERCGMESEAAPLVWIEGQLEKRRDRRGADLEAERHLWALVSFIERRRKGPRETIVRRLERFQACGSLWEFSLVYECEACAYRRLSLYQCGDRHCPRCSRVKSAATARRLVGVLTRGGWRVAKKPRAGWTEKVTAHRDGAEIVPGLRWIRRVEPAPEHAIYFATFTFGERLMRGRSLAGALKYAREVWKRFSRRKAWRADKDGPEGGFRKIEYVWKPDEAGGDGWWHVHIHALVVARTWTPGANEWRETRGGKSFRVERPAQESAIFKAWRGAGGGDPPGQKILRVYGESLTAAAIEACKYTSKFEADPQALPAARLGEAMEAMGSKDVAGRKRSRVRMLQGWGEWFGLRPDATCDECEAWYGEGCGTQCACGTVHRRPRAWEPARVARCACGRSPAIHPEKSCAVCGWLRTNEPACVECGEVSWRIVGAAWFGRGGCEHGGTTSGDGGHDPGGGIGRERRGRSHRHAEPIGAGVAAASG